MRINTSQDPTTVVLTVLSRDANKAERLVKDQANRYSDFVLNKILLTNFYFDDVPWGTLHGLNKLFSEGIPFIALIKEGKNFPVQKEISFYDEKGENHYYKVISTHESCELSFWTEQEKYSNRYLTRKLIGA